MMTFTWLSRTIFPFFVVIVHSTLSQRIQQPKQDSAAYRMVQQLEKKDIAKSSDKQNSKQSTSYKNAVGALANDLQVQAIATANNLFGGKLLEKIREEHGQNLIYSPFILSSALAQLRLGAKGETEEQIVASTFLPPNQVFVNSVYAKIMPSFKEIANGGACELSMANRLYIQNNYKIRQNFTETLKEFYEVQPERIDFGKPGSVEVINKWVTTMTHNKIQSLIKEGSVNSLTKLVLVNGIYFKGSWAEKFKSEYTTDRTFYLSDKNKTTIKVPTMYRQDTFLIKRIPDLKSMVVALPYVGNRLFMVIYAPEKGTEVKSVVQNIKKTSPASILNQLVNASICFYLPKFQLESEIALDNVLQELGMPLMFSSDKADFSGIPDHGGASNELYVSKVVQKAFIEVNEEGAEAAAAQAMKITSRSLGTDIRIERPFLFQIVDTTTYFILFAGVCTDPSKVNNNER